MTSGPAAFNPQPLAMYCTGCGERIVVPVTASFPLACSRCGGSSWISTPPLSPPSPGINQ